MQVWRGKLNVKWLTMVDEKFRSRKWVLTCFVAITATGFLAFKYITGQEWSLLMGGLIGVYNWANVNDPDKLSPPR